MGILIDTISEHASLVKTDIARRGADQAAYRVLFHIFRHVKADQLNAQTICQLLGHFSFTNARGPGK